MIILRTIRWPIKDSKRRILIKKYSINKLVLRSLLGDSSFSLFNKYYFNNCFHKISKKGCISYCRSNCAIFCIGKSVSRITKLSRYIMKQYASHGFVVGFRKSSF